MWSRWRTWLVVAAVAAVVWWFFTGDTPLRVIETVVNQGSRLSTSSLDDSGTVEQSIDELCAQASEVLGRQVDPDTYRMARVCYSEHANGTVKEKEAICQVILNDAREHGWSIAYTIEVGKGLGKQSGRRYSSRLDPHVRDYEIAEAVRAGDVPNWVGSASHFVHKTGFASLGAYEDLCAKWYRAMGIVPVPVSGATSLVVFVPEGQEGTVDG